MRIMMTGGHISLLFIISSFLVLHPSAEAAIIPGPIEKVLETIKKAPDPLQAIIDKHVANRDQPKKLPPKLEAAVKKFQTANGLAATGKIDDATFSLIKRPRCGVDDDSTVSTLRWPWQEKKKELTYAFYNGANVKGVRAVFSRAFGRWENVTGLSFRETASFDGSDIVIVFWKINKKDVAADSRGFGKTRQAMVFQVADWWGPLTGGTEAGDVDLETAVMHQIGHMVGLGHTTIDEAAVMFPLMERGKRKLDFGRIEKLRIQQIFKSHVSKD